MSDIDVSSLSKSELRELLQRSQRRLSRVKATAGTPGIKSSDERVTAIAERVRGLSRELGLKRRDVLAAVAGNMRITVAAPAHAPGDSEATAPDESAAPAVSTAARTRATQAKSGAKATKGNVSARAGRARKAPTRRTGTSKPRRCPGEGSLQSSGHRIRARAAKRRLPGRQDDRRPPKAAGR